MKKILFLFVAAGIIAGCSKDDESNSPDRGNNSQKRFLVSKIFDYNNNLRAVYTYNDNNQLLKRETKDDANNPSSDYQIEYENGKAKNIKYIDYKYPQFNHNIVLIYSTDGKIIRDETYQYGNLIGFKNYAYYSNGKLKAMVDQAGLEWYSVDYNNTVNAMQTKILMEDDGDLGNTATAYREIFRDFRYDDKKKPNFGLGDVFQIEPLPYFGDEALFEKNISHNNMTTFIGSGTQWIYEYNDDGLPITIETRWKDIDTDEPMMLRLEYTEYK